MTRRDFIKISTMASIPLVAGIGCEVSDELIHPKGAYWHPHMAKERLT